MSRARRALQIAAAYLAPAENDAFKFPWWFWPAVGFYVGAVLLAALGGLFS